MTPRPVFSYGAFGHTLCSDVLRAMVISHLNALREHLQLVRKLL